MTNDETYENSTKAAKDGNNSVKDQNANDETNENGIKAEKDDRNFMKDQNANDDNNEDVKKSANDNINSVNDQNDSSTKSKLYTLVNEIIDHEYDNEAACQKKLASSVNLMKQKAEALDEFVTSLCNKTVEKCESESDFLKTLFLQLNAIFLVAKKLQTTSDTGGSDNTDSSLKTLCQCTCDLIGKAFLKSHGKNNDSDSKDGKDDYADMDCYLELLK